MIFIRELRLPFYFICFSQKTTKTADVIVKSYKMHDLHLTMTFCSDII